MQPIKYISDLLYRYECVIVPGFGAFLTHHQSARIDDENNTFHPPHKRISFNRQLQTNDGLLANYVASAERISYEEALQNLRSFTTKINLDLATGKKITFDYIGSFLCEDEGMVQFISDKSENYSTDSFGLTTFVLPKVKREVLLNAVKELEEKAPIIFTPERRNAPAYLKYAAVAAIALVIGGIGGLKWYATDVENKNMAARQQANSLVEQKIQEATFVITNPLPALNLHVEKQKGDFHIVAGAFKEPENAEKKITQLKEKGFSPAIIPTRHGLHQVLYGSFETRKEALAKLQEIKREENADAWLLVQKLD